MTGGSTSAKAKGPGKAKAQINTLPLYVLLIVLFALYIVFQHGLVLSYMVGIALFLTLVAVICLETVNGIKEYGYRRNILEIVVVVLVVLGIWFSLRFFLATKYPLDVVPSCSMLPSLQRGSILLLHGVQGPAQLRAPVVNVSKASYLGMLKEIGTGSLACVAYVQNGSGIQVSQYFTAGAALGLYSSANGGSVMQEGNQKGPVVYECAVTNDTLSGGGVERIVYTKSITIGNTTVTGDRNNSVVVYSTVPQDLFYQEGDGYIVHRVYAILNVSGEYYTLTKGDNNPGLDMQYDNDPANLSQVQGKVVASAPYLGYLKLILSSQFHEPAGCNSTIQN